MLLKYVSVLTTAVSASLLYAPFGFAQNEVVQNPSSSTETPVFVLSGESLSNVREYTLGPDDVIVVNIFDVPEFSGANGTYTIREDGSINAPWVGDVCLLGMTLEEAVNELTRQYQPFINDPLINIELSVRRPVRVSVVGEVNRPGTYESDALDDSAALAGDNVVQAIQSADGITQLADIRNVEITRPQYSCPNTIRYATVTVDLWNLLQSGDLGEDLRLQDGDRVLVNTAADINEAELTEIATASFSPDNININVVGEVVDPGAMALPPNISLNQAILAAGGFDNRRARRGSVDLIRLNPNGSVTKRNIPVDFAEGIDEDNNPPLRDNDVVIVHRSGLTSASDTITTILSPFTTLIGGLGAIFGIGSLFDSGN